MNGSPYTQEEHDRIVGRSYRRTDLDPSLIPFLRKMGLGRILERGIQISSEKNPIKICYDSSRVNGYYYAEVPVQFYDNNREGSVIVMGLNGSGMGDKAKRKIAKNLRFRHIRLSKFQSSWGKGNLTIDSEVVRH